MDHAAAFRKRAKEHWTKEQIAKVTGGKKYLLLPDTAPEILREIGLLNKDASMPADAVRKFSQINHMVSLLAPHLSGLAEKLETVRILDAASGTSFLTLLMGWLFRDEWKKSAQIIGIDHNEAVIKTSKEKAARLGYQQIIKFHREDLKAIDWRVTMEHLFPSDTPREDKAIRPHVLVALHACDTATDDALALGVKLKSDVIAVAPCCQAELAQKWTVLAEQKKTHPLSPLFSAANLRRETAASLTDMLRILLMRSVGYEVTATEFVPSVHTPKNRLITCIRRGNFLKSAEQEYREMKEYLGGEGIYLEGKLV